MRADAVHAGKLGRARRRAVVSAEEERSQLLAEIKDDIDVVCPQYKELAQTLRHFAARYLAPEDPKGAVLGVVSATNGEGRTTVTLGLGGALADLCPNVALVEMGNTPGQPSLSEELGLTAGHGLAGLLGNGLSLEDVVQPTSKGNLWLLPAGQNGQRPARHAAKAATAALLTKLRERYAISLVDMPALLENEEAPALVGLLDGVVLVVAAGLATTEQVAETVALVGDVPLRGVLLNQTHQHAPNWLTTVLES
jgi:Mrp family chromosome partitioning ATPase